MALKDNRKKQESGQKSQKQTIWCHRKNSPCIVIEKGAMCSMWYEPEAEDLCSDCEHFSEKGECENREVSAEAAKEVREGADCEKFKESEEADGDDEFYCAEVMAAKNTADYFGAMLEMLEAGIPSEPAEQRVPETLDAEVVEKETEPASK